MRASILVLSSPLGFCPKVVHAAAQVMRLNKADLESVLNTDSELSCKFYRQAPPSPHLAR